MGSSAYIMRVDDTDAMRSSASSENSVLEDLRWLGLNWDEGPFRQSKRRSLYQEHLQRLIESGHVYPCFDSATRSSREARERSESAWRDAPPDRVRARIEDGVPHTYRFRVPRGRSVSIVDLVRGDVEWDAQATVGDFVVVRSNGDPVYNFVSAVDDALMGVTTVVRGAEHLINTLKQVLILEALGLDVPEFAHLPLLLDSDKKKLSKRHGAASVADLQAEGILPEALLNYLTLLGWNQGSTDKEIYSISELVDAFSIERVVASPAVFDPVKLRWVNSRHLRALPLPSLIERAKPWFAETGWDNDGLLDAAAALAQPRAEVLPDVARVAGEAVRHPLLSTLECPRDEVEDIMADAKALRVVAQAMVRSRAVASGAEFKTEEYNEWVRALGKELGLKGKSLFKPVRLLLTGQPEVRFVLAQHNCSVHCRFLSLFLLLFV